MERGGTLAPGMSLRLVVWLPASGASNLKVSLCHGCVSIYMDRSIAGDHEVFENTDWALKDLVDWKCNGLLPLVALALSGSEEAL